MSEILFVILFQRQPTCSGRQWNGRWGNTRYTNR